MIGLKISIKHLFCLFWFGWVCLSVAHGGTPAALILDIKGTSDPSLQPYTEIEENQSISLAPTSELVFHYYPTCQTITLLGGDIRFEPQGYEASGGNKTVDGTSHCPRKIRCQDKNGCEMAGVVLRGIHQKGNDQSWIPLDTMALFPYSTFILVGQHSADFGTVQISRRDEVISMVPLDHKRFHWPTQRGLFEKHASYILTFLPKSGVTHPSSFQFTVTIPADRLPADEWVLLRVD